MAPKQKVTAPATAAPNPPGFQKLLQVLRVCSSSSLGERESRACSFQPLLLARVAVPYIPTLGMRISLCEIRDQEMSSIKHSMTASLKIPSCFKDNKLLLCKYEP